MKTVTFQSCNIISLPDADYLAIKLQDIDSKIAATQIITDAKDGKQRIAEFKRYSRKRTSEMVAYCWVLCQELAKVLSIKNDKPMTKEEVYVNEIMNVGDFTQHCIHENDVERFKREWGIGHIGRVVDILGYSREHDNYVWIAAYYGISDYNIDEASRLLDAIISECHAQGIDTKTPKEIEQMKQQEIERLKKCQADEQKQQT